MLDTQGKTWRNRETTSTAYSRKVITGWMKDDGTPVAFSNNGGTEVTKYISPDGSVGYANESVLVEPWTPAEITTEAWWDASDANTITGGSAVSNWADKSVNGYDGTQIYGSAQPATGTRTLNGLNVLDFDGASSYLRMNTGPTNDSDAIAIAVVDFDGSSNRQRIFSFQDTVATRWSMRFPDDVTFEYNQDDGSFGGPNTTVSPSVGAKLFSGYREGADAYVGVDGAYVAEIGDSVDGTFTEWRIGAYRGTGQSDPAITYFLDGGLGELIIVKQYSLELRQRLEGYLAWKWGLVDNLDAGHPYKSAPPV